jgi:hypothetical protein
LGPTHVSCAITSLLCETKVGGQALRPPSYNLQTCKVSHKAVVYTYGMWCVERTGAGTSGLSRPTPPPSYPQRPTALPPCSHKLSYPYPLVTPACSTRRSYVMLTCSTEQRPNRRAPHYIQLLLTLLISVSDVTRVLVRTGAVDAVDIGLRCDTSACAHRCRARSGALARCLEL